MALLKNAILRDVFANRPTPGQYCVGRLFCASDTGVIYRDNGTSWDVYGGDSGPTTVQVVDATNQTGNFTAPSFSVPANGMYFVTVYIEVSAFSGAPSSEMRITFDDTIATGRYVSWDDTWSFSPSFDCFEPDFTRGRAHRSHLL
jgi:hypothetical protein